MLKYCIAAAALVIAGIGGYFGYQYYEAQKIVQNTMPLIKEATLRTQSLTDLITDSGNPTSQDITLTAEDLARKMDELMMAAASQKAYFQHNSLDSAVAYMEALQALAHSIQTRAQLLAEAPRLQAMEDDTAQAVNTERTPSILNKLKTNHIAVHVSIEQIQMKKTAASKYFPAEIFLPETSIKNLKNHFRRKDTHNF